MADYSNLKKFAEKMAELPSGSEYTMHADTARAVCSDVIDLLADLESFRQGAKAEADAGDEAREECRKLRAECDDLRKDAERFRFIKNKQTFVWLVADWFPAHKTAWIDVDAAIDDALAREAQHG